MSATIMRFAREWSELIPGLRQRIQGTAAAGNNSSVDVKVGVGLNFNRLDDTTSVEKQWGSSRLSWLAWQAGLEAPAGSRDGVPQINTEALKRIFTQQLDFLGISAYAPYNGGGNFDLEQFENSAFMLCDEMKSVYGIDIKGLADSGKLELQYSEFGIGGGAGYAGGQVARTPAEVALRPFFGVYGPYKASLDPWAIPANKAFRQTFYYKALQWLADPKIKTHKISSVFIWSMASWDVLGIYPESSTTEGSYRDPLVSAAVATYNEAVKAAKGGPREPSSQGDSKSSKPDSASGSGQGSESQQKAGNSGAAMPEGAADVQQEFAAGAVPGMGDDAGRSGGVRVVVVGPNGAQQVRPASG